MSVVASGRPIQIFGDRMEAVNLLLPLLFIAVAVGDLIFSRQSLSAVEMSFWRGMAATIFLNATHVGMSYTTWFSFPEVHQWINRRYKISLKMAAILALAVVVAVFFVISYAMGVSWLPRPMAQAGLVFIAYDILLIWHGLGQSKGLSLLYNRKLIKAGYLSSSDKGRFYKLESIERRAVHGLILSYGAMQLVPLLAFDFVTPAMLKIFFATVNSIIVAVVIASVFFLPEAHRSNKLLHSARYALWILTPWSFFASVGLLAVHGVEYTVVNCHMAQRSDMNKSQFNSWLYLSLAIGVIYFILGAMQVNGFGHFVIEQAPGLKGLCQLAVAFVVATTVVHCFFDRSFYRLDGVEQDRHNRERLLL